MDPQITHIYGSPDWVVTRYRQLIKELEAAGDELGLHTHAWRWDDHSNDWISDFGDQGWVDHCVSSSFAAFRSSLHRPCRSFRFGDRWMNNQTLELLEKLGTQFDLTLEPGQSGCSLRPDEHFTGSFPDYTLVPQAPYRPHKTDFTKPGGLLQKRRLWMIPLSAGSPKTLPKSPGKRWTKLGPADQAEVQQDHMTLNLAFALSPILDRLLSTLRDPYLVLVARTDVGIEPNYRSNLEQNIEALLSHPSAKRFAFETPKEAINQLRFAH